MNAIITICAKNYIGLSRILGESIKKSNSEVDFYIFVADEFSKDEKNNFVLPENVLIFKEILRIDKDLWDRMSFQYDLTELCTAIKPFCLEFMLEEKHYDKVAYMDPDILVYDNLEYIWNKLDNHAVFLTPHITSLEENFTGQITEEGLLFSGMYNLGFIGINNSKTSKAVLKWWKNRLVDKCFVDVQKSLFYDQKWIDFLPCTIGHEALIDRHLGCNVAPWNFYERKIHKIGDRFMVSSRNTEDQELYPLLFVHYSGYNYKSLINDVIEQKNINMSVNYLDVSLIIEYYKQYLLLNKTMFMEYITFPYSYSTFSNLVEIQPYHRRLYRSMLSNGYKYKMPFDSKGELYCALSASHLLNYKSGVRTGKIKIDDVSQSYGGQLYLINLASKCIIRIIGVTRYMQLMKLMRYYSRYESQIHLISRGFMRNNLR